MLEAVKHTPEDGSPPISYPNDHDLASSPPPAKAVPSHDGPTAGDGGTSLQNETLGGGTDEEGEGETQRSLDLLAPSPVAKSSSSAARAKSDATAGLQSGAPTAAKDDAKQSPKG